MLTSPAASPRILAIEDDPLLASHLCEHLQRRGFEVTLKQSGEEGLELAGSEDFVITREKKNTGEERK